MQPERPSIKSKLIKFYPVPYVHIYIYKYKLSNRQYTKGQTIKKRKGGEKPTEEYQNWKPTTKQK